MAWQWVKLLVSAVCILIGIVFMALAVFGVNRFHKALNRMHAAAMGDTLGILFVFIGLIVVRGLSMDALKLFLVILFFWTAGPVSGHMISRLEAMTDEDLGEILVIHREDAVRGDGEPVGGPPPRFCKNDVQGDAPSGAKEKREEGEAGEDI